LLPNLDGVEFDMDALNADFEDETIDENGGDDN